MLAFITDTVTIISLICVQRLLNIFLGQDALETSSQPWQAQLIIIAPLTLQDICLVTFNTTRPLVLVLRFCHYNNIFRLFSSLKLWASIVTF